MLHLILIILMQNNAIDDDAGIVLIAVSTNKCRCVQKRLKQMSIFDKDVIGILTRKTAQGLMSGYFTRQHKWISIFLVARSLAKRDL